MLIKDITMSDDSNLDEVTEANELTILKQRARLMGIVFSNNIGVDTLRAKIAAIQAEEPEARAERQEQPNPLDPGADAPQKAAAGTPVLSKAQKQAQIRKRLRDEKMALIRVRITCLDPKKANLPGEIITVANELLGTVRRYVPFGEKTDNGWHIEKCIYDLLKEREFLSIRSTERGNKVFQEHRYVREFALEVLPPLTSAELADLAKVQAAAGLVE